MPKWILALAFAFLMTMFVLCCPWVRADFKVLNLRDAGVQYKYFIDDGRDPLLFPETHKEAIDVSINFDLLRYGFWNNKILSETTNAQYRMVGLNSEMGVRVFPSLELLYSHTSEHILDRAHSYLPKFPVEDSIGFRFKFFDLGSEKRALIQ